MDATWLKGKLLLLGAALMGGAVAIGFSLTADVREDDVESYCHASPYDCR